MFVDMNGPSQTTQKHAMSTRRALVVALPCLLALGLLAQACTLTNDDFTPSRVELQELPDAGVRVTASQPSSVSSCSDPRGCCQTDADCSTGQRCAGEVCVVESCEGAEDVRACQLELCPGPGCTSAAPSCTDHITNQDETDEDCGGACSARCSAGQHCNVGSDCDSGLFCPLQTRVCTDSSCQDGKQSGSEIFADCGGGECPGCPAGTACSKWTDCASGICGTDGECSVPSCSDRVQNQDETGQDCGGACPATCAPGSACSEASDCDSGVCAAGGCQPGTSTCCQSPSCTDGVANGNEPVTDCGSVTSCGLCAIGHACTNDAQCQTGRCNGTCQPEPACTDGALSGTESDVDCGGADPTCARCQDGDSCRAGADCASGNCEGSICISCADRRKDGTETGVDCGGTCPACPNGSSCVSLADCASGACSDGVCTSCGDNARNGSETDTDCGGSDLACGRCAPGAACQVDGDCASLACQGGRCCGGSQGDCTRCAERLSPAIDCNLPEAGIDSIGVGICGAFLSCLANNPTLCPTRNAAGCSGDNQATDACPHNDYGGNAGTGLARANQVLENAGCQL